MSRDLHRFMSFAFAGADLLVELDRQRNTVAHGAMAGAALARPLRPHPRPRDPAGYTSLGEGGRSLAESIVSLRALNALVALLRLKA